MSDTDLPEPFNRYQAAWLVRELNAIKARLAKLEQPAPSVEGLRGMMDTGPLPEPPQGAR